MTATQPRPSDAAPPRAADTAAVPRGTAHPDAGPRVDLGAPPVLPAARSSLLREQWPARRVLVAAVSFPLLLLLLTDAGGGWVGGLAPGWTAALGAAALFGAGTVGSYVPLRGSGTAVDTGCTTCSALAAASVVCAALTLANNAPHALAAALVAAGFTLLGLTQRVVGQASCATR